MARSAKMQEEVPERASAEQLGGRVEDRDSGKGSSREGESRGEKRPGEKVHC